MLVIQQYDLYIRAIIEKRNKQIDDFDHPEISI
jgi:hypothetical protein